MNDTVLVNNNNNNNSRHHHHDDGDDDASDSVAFLLNIFNYEYVSEIALQKVLVTDRRNICKYVPAKQKSLHCAVLLRMDVI